MLVDPDNTVQQELDLVVFRDGCGKAKMMYRSFDSHSWQATTVHKIFFMYMPQNRVFILLKRWSLNAFKNQSEQLRRCSSGAWIEHWHKWDKEWQETEPYICPSNTGWSSAVCHGAHCVLSSQHQQLKLPESWIKKDSCDWSGRRDTWMILTVRMTNPYALLEISRVLILATQIID